MSNRSHASILRWLFCCAICLSTLELHAQEPKPVIVVESWLVAIDFQKLRSLDLTWDQVGADGQIRTIKIVDVLAGKVDNAQIVQRPEELLKWLQRSGVARILAEPKMTTFSGQKATLEIGRPENGLKIETTPIANWKGQVRLEYRAEINEPLPGPRGVKALFNTEPPAKKQMQVHFSAETESGQVAFHGSFALGIPNSPEPLPIAFVRATIEKSASLQPAVTTANATNREIR